MPIYSYADESLTLNMTPRLKRILKLYKDNEPVDKEDIGYLIDSAARWTTFEKVVYGNRGIEIDISKGMLESDTVELGEIISNIVQETNGLSATNFNSDVSEYYIDTLKLSGSFNVEKSVKTISKEFKDGQRSVKDLQKDFDKKSDNICVIGFLGELDKYTPNFYFKADTDIEKVIKDYLLFKKSQLEQNLSEKETKLKEIEAELNK